MIYARKLLFIYYVTIMIIQQIRSQNLQSTCPDVFRYNNDPTIGLYGEISIVVQPTTLVQLNVEMSIGNMVEGYNGKIELTNPKAAIFNVRSGLPLRYNLFFPTWYNIPPKISQIRVNGNLVCSGSKIPINSVRYITTINLQHTLKIDVQPLSSSNISPDNNYIHNRVASVSQFDEPTEERFNFFGIPSSSQNEDFGQGRRAVQKNRFNFNPTVPPNRFNFNTPTGGLHPAEVYKGNPFFRNITRMNNTEKPPKTNISNRRQQPTEATSTNVDLDVGFPEEDEFDIVSKHSITPTRPFSDICGQSVVTNHLIYNGHSVPRGAYPWLVAIFAVKDDGLKYICSGSLFSNSHVVTAAHCVQYEGKKMRPKQLVLILGKLNIQKWTPVNGERIVEPAAIYVHPDYESLNSDADIAVIQIGEPIEFTKFIKPICLWKGSTDLSDVVGDTGTVVGWGKDENGILMTEEPKQTNLPVVSQEKCLASHYQYHLVTSNRTFCAGFRDGSGPCNGDSGGGFIMKVDGRWILRGIVSLSISDSPTKSCDLSNFVVFCDASKYTNWLLSFLK